MTGVVEGTSNKNHRTVIIYSIHEVLILAHYTTEIDEDIKLYEKASPFDFRP